MATSLGEGKAWIQTLLKKIELVLHQVCAEGLGKYKHFQSYYTSLYSQIIPILSFCIKIIQALRTKKKIV